MSATIIDGRAIAQALRNRIAAEAASLKAAHGNDPQKLVAATGGKLSTTGYAILWSSAILSAIIDNIPFVATMIPLIKSMAGSFGGEAGRQSRDVPFSRRVERSSGGDGRAVLHLHSAAGPRSSGVLDALEPEAVAFMAPKEL